MRVLHTPFSTTLRSRLRARLHLALLRHALALRVGETSDPRPTSPFGNPVRFDTTGGVIRISAIVDSRDVLEVVVR